MYEELIKIAQFILPIIIGTTVGSFTAGKIIGSSITKINDRLLAAEDKLIKNEETLKSNESNRDSFCDKRWDELIVAHKDHTEKSVIKLCSSMKEIIHGVEKERGKDISEIKLNIAVLTTKMGEVDIIKKMMVSIVGRRSDDHEQIQEGT